LINSTQLPLQQQIDQFIWFHSIDFGNGLIARGRKDLADLRLEKAAYFDGLDLNDQSVLDIGAWNGAISFDAKQRGARRVVASDKYAWAHPHYRGRETFELGRSLLGLDIEAAEVDLPDLSEKVVGLFNVVMFLGVFYHLYDAPTLTKKVGELATDLLILETHQDGLGIGRPGMVYYPGDTLAGDPTNFWGPNPECVYEMLLELGFYRVFYQDHPSQNFSNLSSPHYRGRGIFHAFRNDTALERFSPSASKNWFDLSKSESRAEVFRPITPRMDQLEADLAQARVELAQAKADLDSIRNSTTWRYAETVRRFLLRR
jgi:tRNA (mo5U34)-methyltransferase